MQLKNVPIKPAALPAKVDIWLVSIHAHQTTNALLTVTQQFSHVSHLFHHDDTT